MTPEMNNNSATQEEYETTKKGFVEKLIDLIKKSPDAVELSSNDRVYYKDVLDDEGNVKEEYQPWLKRKIMNILLGRRILGK